jgi:hypothetical protein
MNRRTLLNEFSIAALGFAFDLLLLWIAHRLGW